MPISLIRVFSLFLLLFILVFAGEENNIYLDSLSKQAQKENKYIILYFHKFGCGFCEKMQDKTLDDATIDRLIDKEFILVDIGIDDEGMVKYKEFYGSKHDFAKSLEIDFYPTVGFVDSNNSIVYGVIGYRDRDAFKTILDYIYSKAYKKMTLEEYTSEVEFENDE